MKASTGPGVEVLFTWKTTLNDPCASVVFTNPTLVNKNYYVADGADTYTQPAFTASPDFCDFVYSYEVPKLANNGEPI